ncbi:hypothetical protein BJV82DRAFT_624305, partial [Fennellomyces sp. T-0311]
MSNVLRFRSFHERHFSPEQVRYWQSILNQQSSASQWQQYDGLQHAETAGDDENYEEEDYYEEGYEEEYVQEDTDEQPQTTLSEEAIEIFKFSEAYRKER